MSIASESLLAVTGFVAPELTEARLAEADAVPLKIADRMHRWLSGGKVKHAWRPPRVYKPEALRARLAVDATELPGQEVLPDVLAAEWILEVNEARKSMLQAWPALNLAGGLDTREPPLAFDRQQDWLSLVAAVEDFFGFLTDLELGAALPLQVDMVRENYPELSNLVTEAMFATIVEMSGKGRDLAPGKDRSARMWLGIDEAVPLIQAAEQSEPPPEQSGPKGVEELKTPAQKAEM